MTEPQQDTGQGGELARSENAIAQPAKLLRIGTMTRQLLEEARRAPLDTEGRDRLREIHDRSLRELAEALSPDLQEELAELVLPFADGTPTESELRISQAQLVGWLEGLFHGIQAALWTQQVAQSQMPHRLPSGASEPGEGPGPGRYL